MSKVQRKIQFARERGVFVFRWPTLYERVARGVFVYRLHQYGESFGEWAVYATGEWNPRVGFTRREAVNLAYSLAIAKKHKIKVEVW